ncbi:MAG TPA: mitofilin family membrane protein [Magnetospirillaceae bacterium]|jgi:hypothetical protein
MSDTPALPPLEPRQRFPRAGLSGFAGGLVGGVAVAIVAGAALTAAWPSLRSQIIPEPRNDDAALATLDHRIAALEAAAGHAGDDSKATVADLTKRLDALEQASRNPQAPATDPRVAELSSKIDEMNAQIATLRAANASAADLQPLVQRAEDAAQTAKDAAAKRQSSEALLIVTGQLHDAVERGGAYTNELAAARKVAPPEAQDALNALAASADSGVTPLQTLIDSYPPVASAIARAAMMANVEDDFLGRLEQKASTLVSIRRTDGQGNDPAAIAARAEKDLKADNLAGAVKELSALDGPSATEAKDWLKAAQARLNAEQALSDLTAKSAAAINPSAG